MVFWGAASDEQKQAAAAKDTAGQQKLCTAAVAQWWLDLQHQLEAQSTKDDDEDDAKKPFLLQTTDALQPLLDIVFFRFWDMEHLRADGERYISVEQTLRFLEDMVRDNEGPALAAIKDYVKYKLTSGAKANDNVVAKKKEIVEARVKAALDEFDLATAVGNDDISIDALEAAIAKAKVDKVDTAITKEADKTLTAAKDKEEKKVKAAQQLEDKEKKGHEIAAEKRAKDDLAAATDEKLKEKLDKADAAKAKSDEDKKAKEEKAAEAKADEVAKAAEARAAERKAKEEEVEKDAGDFFADRFGTAVDDVVAEMEKAYKKRPFGIRQKASAKFLEWTESKADSGKTITQNELNKILNLAEADKFNEYCKELGFNVDSFDDVLGKAKLSDDEEKEEE